MSKVTSSLSFVLSAMALEICATPEAFRTQAKASKVPLNLINDVCVQAQILVENLTEKSSLANSEQKSLSDTLSGFRAFHVRHCQGKAEIREPLRKFCESAVIKQTNTVRSSNNSLVLRMVDLIDQYGLVGKFITTQEMDKLMFLDKIPMVCQAFAVHGKETLMYQINRLDVTSEISDEFVEAAIWLNQTYYKSVDIDELTDASHIHQKVSTMIDFMAKYARSKSKFYSYILNFKYRYINSYMEHPEANEAKKYKELSAFILNNFAKAEAAMTEEQKAPSSSSKKLELASLLREPTEDKKVSEQKQLPLESESVPVDELVEVPAESASEKVRPVKKPKRIKLNPKFKKEEKPVVIRGVGPALMSMVSSFNATHLDTPRLMLIDLDEDTQSDIISVLGQTSLYGFVLDIPDTEFFEEQSYTFAESLDGKVYMFGIHYVSSKGRVGLTIQNFIQQVETAADAIRVFYNYLVESQTRISGEPLVVEVSKRTKVGTEKPVYENCDEYSENFILEFAHLGLITYEEEVVKTTRAVFKMPTTVSVE
jgi:hypothetical protein